jgi:hypothetical protein
MLCIIFRDRVLYNKFESVTTGFKDMLVCCNVLWFMSRRITKKKKKK